LKFTSAAIQVIQNHERKIASALVVFFSINFDLLCKRIRKGAGAASKKNFLSEPMPHQDDAQQFPRSAY
jgi:hypothetical protein